MRLSSIKSKTYVKNQMKNSQKYFMPFWVNRKDLEIESDVANWAQIFDVIPEKNKNTDQN